MRMLLVGIRVGQQRQETGALDGRGQLTLVLGAGARDTARNDLAGLAHVLLEQVQVLVIDVRDAFGRETAILPASKIA